MYVVPNDPARLGTWEPHAPGLPEPGGDYTFIKETAEKMGPPVWREEVTSVLRPGISRGPSISIVTPWHEHRELVTDYFMAIGQRRPTDEFIVVDNGSDPPLPFATVYSEENLGFAEGSNVGLRHARHDAVLFLNNDIEMLRPGWLEEIRRALSPGVLVGQLRYDGHADIEGRPMPYLDGWCLAGMREDLLQLGGFDSSLVEPAYYSDNLLCLEARAAGMSLREVRIDLVHKENVTAGSQFEPVVQAASSANRARYEARARELLAAV
jgi:GT2 family glycosyltransferase